MEERPESQTMFFDVMPDILNRLFRSRIIEEVRLEKKPFHSDEGEVVMFKDQVLHIEEGPGRPPFKDPVFHLLVDRCPGIRGENRELSDIGVESFRITDRLANRLNGIMESSENIGGMDLQAVPLEHLHRPNRLLHLKPLP